MKKLSKKLIYDGVFQSLYNTVPQQINPKLEEELENKIFNSLQSIFWYGMKFVIKKQIKIDINQI